jgi:outer membrane protein insertion porin family
VDEGLPRLVWGRVGWRSEAGVAGEAHWTHRDFLGGARSFTVSTNVESGWGALESNRGRSLGVAALVRQPYLMQRTLAGTFGPFARYRDDFRDQSLLFGIESSLIYTKRPLETVTLQHELSRLRVDDAFQLTPVRDLVESGDSLFSPVFVRSVIRLSGTYGVLDDRIDPRSGYLIEPALEITGPSGITDVEFFRAGLQAMAAVPLSRRAGLFLRASGGRLFPFGASDPSSGAARTRSTVGLRGAMLTGGGTSDVRGWGRGLLGSKIPDVDVDVDGIVSAQRFVPAGGLARLMGSVEVGLPFPFLDPPHGTHVFLDGGRVWSPGDVFDPGDPELVLEDWGYSVGAGFQIGSLVGPVRLSVGYKLNPTTVDLLSPGDVARALVDGVSLATLEPESFRRWHLHLSLGRGL